MVIIPGETATGQVWRMSFFQAFYFISYTGTTIGYGELPHTFTETQRAWVLICIYMSVIAWLYAIGSVLTLAQDKTFQKALHQHRVRKLIRDIRHPFYIICGFGETGRMINTGLTAMGLRTVIIDQDDDKTTSLELDNMRLAPIAFVGDATDPSLLLQAGVNKASCKGIIVVTSDDHVNLKVSVSSKLLNSHLPVFCRSEIEDEANNMASFGTDLIVNPYHTFAQGLNLLAHKSAMYKIHSWLINQRNPLHLADRNLPKGRWILCGYGRMGKAIAHALNKDGIELIIVDPDPVKNNAPEGAIVGRGTEAKTLREAGINHANLVIAASDDDANNLSTLITAKQLQPNIYTIGRVSDEINQVLFKQAHCDYIMRHSQVVANEVLTAISRPLVGRFIKYSSSLNEEDTLQLLNSIEELGARHDPVTWRLNINLSDAPALYDHLKSGKSLKIQHVCNHPQVPNGKCLPLLLLRKDTSQLLPNIDTQLQIDDELLVCVHRKYITLAERLADNAELVDSLVNTNQHYIPILRWWTNKGK